MSSLVVIKTKGTHYTHGALNLTNKTREPQQKEAKTKHTLEEM